jgi:hypothetical protein
MYVCFKPMNIVQQILNMDDVIHFLLDSFLTLQIGLLSAEVREYVYRSTQLVKKEEETISHKVLSKAKQQ